MNHKINDSVKDIVVERTNGLEEMEWKTREFKKLKEKFLQLKKEGISDKEFFENYMEVYKIDRDGLKKEYAERVLKNPRLITLNTEKTLVTYDTEGRGRGFDYWYDWYLCKCEVYASEDFTPSDKRYSLAELNQLVNQNKIVINNFMKDEKISDTLYAELTEKNETIELSDINRYVSYKKFNESYYAKLEKDFPEAIRIVRDSYTEEQSKEDLNVFKSIEVKSKVVISEYLNKVKESNNGLEERISGIMNGLES